MTRSWKEIWNRRQLPEGVGSVLEQLMAADGLDTGFGNVSASAWTDFVRHVARQLELAPGDSVFEVGCGAGAFLYELDRMGCRIGGIDQSEALIGYARRFLPNGDFLTGDAGQLPLEPQADAVLSCGVFLYFPELDYAARVLRRMAARAGRALAILDIPDRERQAMAMALRRGTLGEEAYAEKYRGLDHLYYDKSWFADRLPELGFEPIAIADQAIPGYANAAYRFNVFARRRVVSP